MRAFSCPVCRRLVTFESSVCLHSDTPLAFHPVAREMVELGPDDHRCANAALIGCNWLADAEGELCRSCALTRTRPADGDEDGLRGWAEAEAAKRRLLFELWELGLDTEGLTFDLLSSADGPVTTGHADGVITIDLAEADDAQREQRRTELGEPYRTVLGHLRHEVAHFLQPRLVPEGSAIEDECRAVFGDERADYQAAIDRHYASGPPDDWPQRFVSAYATMHPWEDWAETTAHLLHIRDTLQTAAAYGVRVDGPALPTTDPAPLAAEPDPAPDDVRAMLDAWLPLTYALNAINRSMGAGDLYPFVLTPEIERKLAFVDRLIRRAG